MQKKWSLDDLGPSFPSDWTPYYFLVMELKASSPQYFDLIIHTAQGKRSIRVHPFQGVWIRAAIPLYHFREPMTGGYDLASLGNKPRKTFWINFHRNQGPLTQVEGVEIRIPAPIGTPSVEIRSMRLAVDDPGDAVLDVLPLVDEFGQWIPDEWPGKAHSLNDLLAAWAQENDSYGMAELPVSRYGGFLEAQVEGTGFFRTQQIDGRWWLVDPEGYLFFSTGVDVLTPWGATRTAGREEIFAALPPEAFRQDARKGFGETFSSFPTWNLYRRFGDDWQQKWVDMTLRRMACWGLNTIASWSDSNLWDAHQRPYVVTLSGWEIEESLMGLPDIYAEGYAEKVDQAAARQCAPRREDPWLLGYFIGNEPAWPERELLLVDEILSGSPSALQAALQRHLAKFGDSPEQRTAFIHATFEKFLSLVVSAIRRHDPNHLNLGIRFGGTTPEAIIRMASVFDVYSHNIYAYVPDAAFLSRIYELTGRPMIIGEFHFGTPGRGMDSGLNQVLNQAERGAAYRYYVENAAAHPAMVGTHWFQWWDQPATGRFDGENYNIGLVDITDRPYPEMVEAMRATHSRLYAVHAGMEPPTNRLPIGIGESILYE